MCRSTVKTVSQKISAYWIFLAQSWSHICSQNIRHYNCPWQTYEVQSNTALFHTLNTVVTYSHKQILWESLVLIFIFHSWSQKLVTPRRYINNAPQPKTAMFLNQHSTIVALQFILNRTFQFIQNSRYINFSSMKKYNFYFGFYVQKYFSSKHYQTFTFIWILFW